MSVKWAAPEPSLLARCCHNLNSPKYYYYYYYYSKCEILFVLRLTAFVMRVFCKIQEFPGIDIDEKLLCDSVNWLIQNQRADGALPEINMVIHREMVVRYVRPYFRNPVIVNPVVKMRPHPAAHTHKPTRGSTPHPLHPRAHITNLQEPIICGPDKSYRKKVNGEPDVFHSTPM